MIYIFKDSSFLNQFLKICVYLLCVCTQTCVHIFTYTPICCVCAHMYVYLCVISWLKNSTSVGILVTITLTIAKLHFVPCPLFTGELLFLDRSLEVKSHGSKSPEGWRQLCCSQDCLSKEACQQLNCIT